MRSMFQSETYGNIDSTVVSQHAEVATMTPLLHANSATFCMHEPSATRSLWLSHTYSAHRNWVGGLRLAGRRLEIGP